MIINGACGIDGMGSAVVQVPIIVVGGRVLIPLLPTATRSSDWASTTHDGSIAPLAICTSSSCWGE